ncbi:NAD(P)-dependent alcohol dehydrogenase [Natrialbaceae archaeon A-CW3]
MRAVVQDEYGSPDLLEISDIDRPAIEDDEVLMKVHSAAVNPADWHLMRGEAYIVRLVSGLRTPKIAVRGLDVAGIVHAVGEDVRDIEPGDEVFGEGIGTFAEYARAEEAKIADKPDSLSFEQAACVPIAAVTALQGLRDVGGVRPDDRVLINGASGGVGIFAVQIATSFGAEVTGVCSGANVEMVRSLGASDVVDYTKEDFSKQEQQYDIVFDLAGNRSLSELRRVLTPDGTLVLCSGEGGKWFGPAGSFLKALVTSRFVGQELRPFMASVSTEDLEALAELLDAKRVSPVIDRTYDLNETPEAIRYIETGRARGKVVINIDDDGQ